MPQIHKCSPKNAAFPQFGPKPNILNLGSSLFFGNGEAALCIESPSVTKSTDAGGSFVRGNLGSNLFRAAEPPPTKSGADKNKPLTDVCASNKLF